MAPMTKLIAKKRLDYAGKPYRIGEPFSATAADARILTVTGLAALAEPETPAPAAEPRAKRQYRRRDMRAEA